uniref:disease resistance protein Roq1-like isoform X2 n=1 Tax=Erigeron canadensis TaxID=72917 RepID=UPI001CB9B09B|nr:disease resistance protein Roq1-like isoform X2 [Erigeron canadensis]
MASSSSSSHSDHAFSRTWWKYDVFLSFRGEDTRKTFVDHLYNAIAHRLIRTYKDDEELPRGDSIGSSLRMAIEESQIAVIVFSKNYADSSWCLNELVYIMKCRDERGLIVMPIFYDVDPSEVRNQKGKFGEAFAKQVAKNITKAELWRKALDEATNIAGWELKHIAGGHESKAIKQIVDRVQEILFSSISNVDEELVGMRARFQDLMTHLEIDSVGVRMVGLWGIGGGGKTTLAFSLYTEISRHFKGHCFIANIREQSKHGLETLQQKLLSTVFKTQIAVQSVEEGKCIIKSMSCNNKVLVFLDDVDDLDQLQALAGSHNWFGVGSRIIITTRDEHVLTAHRVDHISPVKLLSDEEAILLLYKHAYNEKKPLKDYETLSLRVVSYAAGLPLALKVLGSFLFDKDKNEWVSALAKLKDIPNLEVMDILRISYDGLETLHKELFLDIACFFRWKNIDDAMEILDACGFHPIIGIKVLRQKALITIDDYGRFDMHDLVQEMGHYIVRREHPNNPEKHSRVWKHEEISNMCLGDSIYQENHKIEVIETSSYFPRSSTIISNMRKLRWLNMLFGGDAEGPNFLSNEMRYLYWERYPATPFPNSFQASKLVVLKLWKSLQKELWNANYKCLPHLKVLEFCYMKNLVSTPDFDGLPCLQKLTIRMCDEIEEIHPSLGNHRCLQYISVKDCDKLRRFPTIFHMEKLKTLKMRDCDALELPEIQGNLKSIETLSLSRFPIEIQARPTPILRMLGLINLRMLRVDGWSLKDEEIPSDISELCNLEELNLSWNDFSHLGFSLSQLTRLKILKLCGCSCLVELPELPSSVAVLQASWCESLTTIGNNCDTDFKWLRQVSLIRGGIVNDAGRLLVSIIQGRGIQSHCMVLQVEGIEIPKKLLDWLVSGNTCTLQLPENWYNDFCGFIMCAVSPHYYLNVQITMKQVVGNEMGTDSQYEYVAWEKSNDDRRTFVGYVSFGLLKNTSWWDETSKTLSFLFNELKTPCSGFGFELVPKRSGMAPTEASTNSPHFKILHDSASTIEIFLSMC